MLTPCDGRPHAPSKSSAKNNLWTDRKRALRSTELLVHAEPSAVLAVAGSQPVVTGSAPHHTPHSTDSLSSKPSHASWGSGREVARWEVCPSATHAGSAHVPRPPEPDAPRCASPHRTLRSSRAATPHGSPPPPSPRLHRAIVAAARDASVCALCPMRLKRQSLEAPKVTVRSTVGCTLWADVATAQDDEILKPPTHEQLALVQEAQVACAQVLHHGPESTSSAVAFVRITT